MGKGDDMLKVNPIIKKLLEVGEHESIVELDGYIGPSEEGITRLYKSLSLSDYVELPRESILHVIETPGERSGRVKVLVGDSTKVKSVHIKQSRIRAGDLAHPEAPFAGVMTRRRSVNLWHGLMIWVCRAANQRLDEIINKLEKNGSLSKKEVDELRREMDELMDFIDSECRGISSIWYY